MDKYLTSKNHMDSVKVKLNQTNGFIGQVKTSC